MLLNNDLQTSAPAAQADAPVAAASSEYRGKVEKAAEQFEAQFLRQMIKEMRKATREMASEDSVFASSVNSDMLDYADMAVADQLARQRVFGVANAILAQLLPPGGNIHLKSAAAGVASEETGARPTLAAFAEPTLNLKQR